MDDPPRHENYLAWSDEIGDTHTVEQLLVCPLAIRHYDEVQIA